MWERWRPVWQLAVTQTGREYQLHKHIFFQTVWRCHKQFPDPALAPHSCTSHPFYAWKLSPWPHWPTPCLCPWVLCKVYLQSWTQSLFAEALWLPETYGNVSAYTEAGEKCLQPGHTPQGKARGSPQHWPGSSDQQYVPLQPMAVPTVSVPSPRAGAQPGGPLMAQWAGIPLVSLTSYLKMRQLPLQTRPQFWLNDRLFLN